MKKGFTLVEILIVTAIAAALLAASVWLFITYNDYVAYLQASIDVPQSASLVVDSATSAIRQSDQIISSMVFSGTTYTSGANSLVLRLLSVNASGNILAGKYDYIVFYKNGTAVYCLTQADASSARVSTLRGLSNTVDSLIFTYDNTDITISQKIDISVQSSKQVKNGTVQNSLHQQVYFRNK